MHHLANEVIHGTIREGCFDISLRLSYLDAIRSRESIILRDRIIHERIIGGWTPHYEALSHTFWCTSGDCSWLIMMMDDRNRNLMPVLPLPSLGYFQQS
jgi:hypothetical protein